MYRGDLREPGRPGPSRILALGPVFIAAALATFSGEHFTQAREFSQLVPKWLPLRVPLTYFVGICLLAAALSFVARRGIRWSAPLLSLLFALFVLLIYLPSLIANPGVRIAWIFPFREGTYAVGALCVVVYGSWSVKPSSSVALALRLWTAVVAIFFGLQNILYPQFTPGVPDQQPTSAWVPVPHGQLRWRRRNDDPSQSCARAADSRSPDRRSTVQPRPGRGDCPGHHSLDQNRRLSARG